MTEERKPLTRSEIASLGGLAAAHKLGAAGRKARASKGADAVFEKYGQYHMKKMSLIRHGKLKKPGASKPKVEPVKAAEPVKPPEDEEWW